MTGEQRIKQLIADLDGAARREIASAASEGRFDELPTLATLAQEIAALAGRWRLGLQNQQQPATQIADGPTSPPVIEETIPNAPKTDRKVSKTDYPQFLREKQDLVKLGWSHRKKEPYEHRVSKTAVDVISTAVTALGNAGHRFTMHEILKSLDGVNSTGTIPSYQMYAVVSWLKWAGMILQHGRQGYTIIRPQTIASSIETAWQSLPQR